MWNDFIKIATSLNIHSFIHSGDLYSASNMLVLIIYGLDLYLLLMAIDEKPSLLYVPL